MPLFTTSVSSITRPGIYLAPIKPPAVIRAQGSGVGAMICQTPWGPPGVLYAPTSDGDRNLTYAPPGFNRLAPGVLAMIEKGWNNLLKVARVLSGTAAPATCTASNAVPTALLTTTAKYPGADGNSLIQTIGLAGDGNVNHFRLTLSISGASGTTSEVYDNGNISGVGADFLWPTQLLSSRLAGSFTKLATGVPIASSASFTSGTNGTAVASLDYVGVPTTANAGIALLEGDSTIRQFCTDDCGVGLRTAVTAGTAAHASLMGDRVAFINGVSGMTTGAAAVTDAANNQGVNVCYGDPWCNEYDDVAGALQLVSPAPFLMSMAMQLPPSLRLGWRDTSVMNMLQGIVSLQFNRGQQAAANTQGGVTTIEMEPTGAGGFCVELDVVTAAPLDSTQADLPRTRMGIYVGTAVQSSLRSYTNGPNVPLTQQQIVTAFTEFMDTLVLNKEENPFTLPYLLGYKMGNIAAVNTPNQQAAGAFLVPVQFQTDTGMQDVIFEVQYGPSVSVTLVGTTNASGG